MYSAMITMSYPIVISLYCCCLSYVWNTFYLGLRLLVEARSVLDYNGNLG